MRIPLRQYWDLLVSYLRPQWRRAVALGVLLLASIGLQLTSPQILRHFIDTAVAGGALRTLTLSALLYLAVALVTQVISVAEAYVAENVGWTATNRLRSDLMLHCLRLDPPFHQTHTPGTMIERIDGDVSALSNFFSRFVVQVLGNALLLLGVLVLLWFVDWRVGLSLTAFVVVALVVINGLRDFAVPHWQAAREASAALFGFLEERLAGTEDIRSNGATAYALGGLHVHSRSLLQKQLRAVVMGSSTFATTIILFTLSMALAFAISAYLYRLDAITIGTAFLIFNYTEMLSRPIEQISRQIQDLQQAGASIGRIRSLFELRSVIEDGPGAALPGGALPVELDRVSFGYGDEGAVLRDVSFDLQPGTTLGLLGRTGSGKTTLTRLLYRLYDPTEGAVRLGGLDLRQAKVAEVRQRVAIVTQDIQLFHASVRDNLTFFDPAVPDERIVEVLDVLGLKSWYDSLAEGLETRLAPGGSGLSAGQAQLLAFARVFLRDPGLVILDEASSRLDPATERLVDRAVDLLLCPEGTRRTAIIIAHRLGTVQRADEIMILDSGRIAEHGPRAQLAHDPDSRFSRLLRTGIEEALA